MKKLVIILALLVLVFGGTTFYFYKRSNLSSVSDPKADQEEAKALVEKVSKLIVLPEGEIPTIATISDLEKLKDQTFFTDAKNGDKVLIYTNTKKAILYDPVANKIINVAPLSFDDKKAITQVPIPDPTPASEFTPPPTP